MEKNYNFERKKLLLPEYGRHIHQMVDYLRTIPDRTTRNEQAHVVVEVMGNINPVLRDAVDFKHKLWDHLFIMSEFKLDVDSPYPIPDKKLLHPIPDKIEYPVKRIARKHYGKNIAQMLKGLKNIPDQQTRTTIGANIARYMRAKSFEYNQEYPNNDVILKDVNNMSDNCIELTDSIFNSARNDNKSTQINNRQRKNFTLTNRNNAKNGNRNNNRPANKYRQNRNLHK